MTRLALERFASVDELLDDKDLCKSWPLINNDNLALETWTCLNTLDNAYRAGLEAAEKERNRLKEIEKAEKARLKAEEQAKKKEAKEAEKAEHARLKEIEKAEKARLKEAEAAENARLKDAEKSASELVREAVTGKARVKARVKPRESAHVVYNTTSPSNALYLSNGAKAMKSGESFPKRLTSLAKLCLPCETISCFEKLLT